MGRYINHSCEPNAVFKRVLEGDADTYGLVLTHDVKKGDEVTADYTFLRDAVFGGYMADVPSCKKPSKKTAKKKK